MDLYIACLSFTFSQQENITLVENNVSIVVNCHICNLFDKKLEKSLHEVDNSCLDPGALRLTLGENTCVYAKLVLAYRPYNFG